MCSGNFLKALCCLLHGGLLALDDRAGFSVAVNLAVPLPRQLSVSLTSSCSSAGIGSWHEALQICILEG